MHCHELLKKFQWACVVCAVEGVLRHHGAAAAGDGGVGKRADAAAGRLAALPLRQDIPAARQERKEQAPHQDPRQHARAALEPDLRLLRNTDSRYQEEGLRGETL